MEFYEKGLNALEREFYLKIIQGLQVWASEIKSSHITTLSSYKKCIRAVEYDRPDLFHVNFLNQQYREYSDGWAFVPEYIYNKEEGLLKLNQFYGIAHGLKMEMEKAGLRTVYEKCNYIHTYLVSNCRYDHEAYYDTLHPEKYLKSYTMEGPIFYGKGVCKGISLAYRALCRRCCSVNAFVVEGKAVSPFHEGGVELHAWNLVYMGDWSAHVDATWDIGYSEQVEFVKKDYFFISDAEISADHFFSGYPACNPVNLSYFDVNGLNVYKVRDLNDMIKTKFLQGRKKLDKGKNYFYFKVKNDKLTLDKVQEYAVGKLAWYCLRKNMLIYYNTSQRTVLIQMIRK